MCFIIIIILSFFLLGFWLNCYEAKCYLKDQHLFDRKIPYDAAGGYWFTYGAASELYAYAASDLLPICTNVKMIYAHMLHVN